MKNSKKIPFRLLAISVANLSLFTQFALATDYFYGNGYDSTSSIDWSAMTDADTLNLVVGGTTPTAVNTSLSQTVTLKTLNFYNTTEGYGAGKVNNTLNIYENGFINAESIGAYKNIGDTTMAGQNIRLNFYGISAGLSNTEYTVTNAKNVFARSFKVYGAKTTWLFDVPDGNYHFTEFLQVNGRNENAGGAMTFRSGTIRSDSIGVSENDWRTGQVVEGKINIEGATVIARLIGLGVNAAGSPTSQQSFQGDVTINFTKGILKPASDALTIQDNSATDPTKFLNTGQLWMRFGGDVDATGASVNIFEIGANKRISIHKSVKIGDWIDENGQNAQKGGFTIIGEGTGTFSTYATGSIGGGITVKGGNNFINYGQINVGGTVNHTSTGVFRNEADGSTFADINLSSGFFQSFKDNSGNKLDTAATYGSINISGNTTFESYGASTFKDITFRGTTFTLSNFEGGKVLGKFDIASQNVQTISFNTEARRQFLSDATLIRIGENVTLSNQERYKNDNGELNPDFTVFTIKANQTLAGGGNFQNTGAYCLFENGKMYGSNMLIQGTLAPSSDDGKAGMMKFWGDLVFDSTAIIKLDVFGTSESKFDRVQSLYSTSYFAMRDYDEDGIYATLIFDVSQFDLSDSGILNITDFLKLNNAEGSITKFDILFQKNGEFVNDPQYWVDYETGNIHFGSIPEPATIATILGAIALGIISYRRRK